MNRKFAPPIDAFNSDIARCRNMVGLADTLSHQAPGLRESVEDTYRAAVVFAISGFDLFVQELIVAGVHEIAIGRGPLHDHPLPEATPKILESLMDNRVAGAAGFAEVTRRSLKRSTFQDPESVTKGLKAVCPINIWQLISNCDTQIARELKMRLKIVAQRRNGIVHESDTSPGIFERYPIDGQIAEEFISSVEEIGNKIGRALSDFYDELPSSLPG